MTLFLLLLLVFAIWQRDKWIPLGAYLVYLFGRVIARLVGEGTVPDDSRTTKEQRMTRPSDADIPRDRATRYLVLGVFVIALPLLSLMLGLFSGALFIGGFAAAFISGVICTVIGLLVTAASVERFFIVRNTQTGVFITQDALRSFLNKPDINVVYGPGVHISYPWEIRTAEGNISIREVAQDFSLVVQCTDGTLTITGSFRLRADHENPVPFLTGAGALASEIVDLVKVDIITFMSGKSIRGGLRTLSKLNEKLAQFKEDHNGLESRFGIQFGDITVSEALPSKEVQKTISAIAEADAIATAVAKLYGMTIRELRAALKSGEVNLDDYNRKFDRMMAASGNMEGMDLRRFEVDVNGAAFKPEVIAMLKGFLESPAGQALVASGGNTSGGSKPKRRRGKRGGKDPKPQTQGGDA